MLNKVLGNNGAWHYYGLVDLGIDAFSRVAFDKSKLLMGFKLCSFYQLEVR